MQISGAGFHPYSSMARVHRTSSSQEASNAQAVRQKQASAVVPDRDGDHDSGKGIDSDRGKNIDIRA